MSQVTAVLLPNTTRYMLKPVATRLARESTPPLVVTGGIVPGWAVAHAPHAQVTMFTNECIQLVLDSKPRLVVIDLCPPSDPLYYKLVQAASRVRAELWCILSDGSPEGAALRTAHTVWLPVGSRWSRNMPPSPHRRYYDADALYLKHDEACGTGNEREGAALLLAQAMQQARQLPIRLAGNGCRVTLVAGFRKGQAHDLDL